MHIGTCAPIAYSNVGWTPSSLVSNCPWNGYNDNSVGDIWFQTTSVTVGFTVNIGSLPTPHSYLTIITGTCTSGYWECTTIYPNQSYTFFKPPGTYLLRIANTLASQQGNIEMCVWQNSSPLNDDCANPVVLPNAVENCTPVGWSNLGATASAPPGSNCGNTDWRDTWFSATSNTTSFSLHTGILPAGTMTIDVFDACGANIVWCGTVDPNNTYTISAPPGNYLFRVSKPMTDPTGAIELCFTTPPPINDECGEAIPLAMGTNSCSLQGYSNFNWSESLTTECNGFGNPDIWFVTTSTITGFTVQLGNTPENTPLSINVFSACGGSMIDCFYLPSNGSHLFPLQPGTYLLKVTGLSSTQEGIINICVWQGVSPSNDNCSGAFPLTMSGGICAPANYSTAGATVSAPSGTNCGATDWRDTWYSVQTDYNQFTIKTGNLPIGTAAIDVYSTCTGTNIWCNTIIANNTYTVTTSAAGTYLIRFSKPMGDPIGDIGLCISEAPPNDNCNTATDIILTDGVGEMTSPNIGWTSSGTIGCGPVAEGDVWLKTTTTQSEFYFEFLSNYFPRNVSIFSGCGGSQIYCHTFNDIEGVNIVAPPSTYYFRVSDNINEQSTDPYGAYFYVFEAIPLPTELTHLSAQKIQKSAHLNWRTATETQNRGFQIKRSHDGKNWQPIGWQPGAGTTTEPQAYFFEDKNPLTGLNFYRLAQLDFDGKEHFSKTVSVEFGDRSGLAVSPNPSGELAQISWFSEREELSVLQVRDLTGRLFFSQKTEAAALEIPVADWPAGIYKIERTSGTLVETTRLAVFH